MHVRELPRTIASGAPRIAGIEAQQLFERVAAKLVGNVPAPTRIGRYVLVDRIGAGAWGVVYRAYDPHLDRRVAVKVMRSDAVGPAVTAARNDRLLREAVALASLSHPNVLPVHDVGMHGDEVFLVLEYIDGDTLDCWLNREPRTDVDIVRLFVEVGRGLHAAHERGIVHRDIKPANILVDGHQRGLVADFGLASHGRARSSEGRESVAPCKPSTAVVGYGTPAYMSPEQRSGLGDARADVYSFCVCLWEALTGSLPIVTTSKVSSSSALAEVGHRDDPRRFIWRRVVSGRWSSRRRALAIARRGLATAPEDRWPSMAAVVTALQRTIDGRRQLGWAAALIAPCVAASALAGSGDSSSELPIVCRDPTGAMNRVWHEQRRAAVTMAFTQVGTSFARESGDKIVAHLDQAAATWPSSQEEACRTLVDAHESARSEALARATCYSHRLSALSNLIDALETVRPENVAPAVVSVASSTVMAHCDAGRLGPRPSNSQPDDELTAIDVLIATGHYEQAIARGRAAIDRFASSPTLVAFVPAAHRLLGEALHLHADRAQSEFHLRRAAALAIARGQDDVAARAQTTLLEVVGFVGARWGEAEIYAEHAQASIARLGGDTLLEADLQVERARLDLKLARPMVAYERLVAAERIYAAGLGPRHPRVATVMRWLNVAQARLGQRDAARASIERGLSIRREHFGERHPGVAEFLNALGVAAYHEQEYDVALGHLHDALDLWRESLGSRHPHASFALVNLAVTYRGVGQLELAEQAAREALPLGHAFYGDPHPSLALYHEVLADILLARGAVAQARSHCDDASRQIQALPPDHPQRDRVAQLESRCSSAKKGGENFR